jgi:uncharacterized membrane protein YdfJ with MMPL/SSD domain
LLIVLGIPFLFTKELAVGAALAVLIDASIIRALLVPSLMALLGSLNWWAPAPPSACPAHRAARGINAGAHGLDAAAIRGITGAT